MGSGTGEKLSSRELELPILKLRYKLVTSMCVCMCKKRELASKPIQWPGEELGLFENTQLIY